MARNKYEGILGGLYRRNESYLIISAVIFITSLMIGYAFAGMLEQMLAASLNSIERQIVEGKLQLSTISLFMNNFKVALILYAGGLTFGLVTVYFLFFNGLFIGYVGSKFPLGDFLIYTIPHGVPEIAGIIIAGAAGFRLSKSLYNLIKGLLKVQTDLSVKNQLRYLWETNQDDMKDSLVLFGIAVILILLAAFIEANLTIAWGNYIRGLM